jgi:small subunit ribosomal protein S17
VKQKTRVGTIEWRKQDPRCGKFQRKRTRLMFHDEKNESQEGDEVLVTETRPLSRHKTFSLVKIVKKARG